MYLKTKKSCISPTAFTPTKKQRIIEVNSENRHLTSQQVKFELKELNANTSKSQLQQLKTMEAEQAIRRIKPKSEFHRRKKHVNFHPRPSRERQQEVEWRVPKDPFE